jgi:hypothetical protein
MRWLGHIGIAAALSWGAPAAATSADYVGEYQGSAIASAPDCGGPVAVLMTIDRNRVRVLLPVGRHLMVGIVDDIGGISANGFWMGLRNRVVDIHLKGRVVHGTFFGTASDGRCRFAITLVRTGAGPMGAS